MITTRSILLRTPRRRIRLTWSIFMLNIEYRCVKAFA
jgi:hypothetical protein